MELLDEEVPKSDKVAKDFVYSGIPQQAIVEMKVEGIEGGQENIEQLIDQLCCFTPTTFGDYLNLLQATAVVLLTQKPHISVSMKKSALRSHLCSIPTKNWIDDPIKVHLATERILSGLKQAKSVDLLNVYHICRQLWCVNDFLFFVCLTLAWTAFHESLNKSQELQNTLRPYSLKYLHQQLKALDVPGYKEDLMKLFVTLSAVSLIILMSLSKAATRNVPFAYVRDLKFAGKEQIKALYDWFYSTQKILRIPAGETMEHVKIREVIEFEIFTALNRELTQSTVLQE